MAQLELSGVRTGYGQVPVLHGVDLSIEEGQPAVLLGLNGAGKTTTLLTGPASSAGGRATSSTTAGRSGPRTSGGW